MAGQTQRYPDNGDLGPDQKMRPLGTKPKPRPNAWILIRAARDWGPKTLQCHGDQKPGPTAASRPDAKTHAKSKATTLQCYDKLRPWRTPDPTMAGQTLRYPDHGDLTMSGPQATTRSGGPDQKRSLKAESPDTSSYAEAMPRPCSRSRSRVVLSFSFMPPREDR